MQQRLHSHIQTSRYSRQSCSRLACKAEAGKGFGTVKSPKPSPKKKQKVAFVDNDSDAVRQAVKLSDKDLKSAPVDPQQASKGKIDYAKVKNWGSESHKDPGALQLESFIQGAPQNAENMAFYTRLTTQILRDKESGLLDDLIFNRLPVTIRKDIPDGSKWVYTKPRYIQYLVDLQAVHHELESGIAEAIAASPEDSSSRLALEYFSQAKGLDRSLELASDLTNLDLSTDHPGPSLHVLSYVKHLRQLATQPAGEDSSGDGAVRLIAHTYANQLHHFTNGSKLGAAVAEKLNLFRLDAVHLYRSYPQKADFPDKNPFTAFTANVNKSGQNLSEEQRKIVEKELPTAVAYSMQLVEPLAHVD